MKTRGSWKKGQSGNPKGRPKGIPNRWTKKMDEAIEQVQKEKGLDLLVQAVRMAYDDPKMMAALLKKILPDKRYVEADIRSVHDDWIKRLEADDAIGPDQGGDLAQETGPDFSDLL